MHTSLLRKMHNHVPLQVGVYHGPERNRSKTWLASQDVIITTYQTLAGDMGQVGCMCAANHGSGGPTPDAKPTAGFSTTCMHTSAVATSV
jgi:hypothetical protein